MTAVCVGGVASTAKPGFGLTVDMTSAALVARFANTAGWFSALIAAAVAGAHYELSTFCANDPPAEPTLTAQDFVDALSVGDFAAKLIAEQKILDWVGAHVWYDLCECTSGTQPTPITYQTAPADLPQINPNVVNPPIPVAPCFIFPYSDTLTVPQTVVHTFAPIAGNSPIQAYFTASITNPTGVAASITLRQYGVDGTVSTMVSRNVGLGQPSNSLTSPMVTQNGTSDHMDLVVGAGGTAGQVGTVSGTLFVFCGGATIGSVVEPCCPPDPVLQGQISQILSLVTLIQRQGVPFGYIPGAVHTSLSGAGALSIAGILGVKVAVTTLPSSYGVAGTSPPEHFDLGFVTFGTPDGFPSAFRLTRNPQVMMPARCGLYTDLDYDLAPGVVVTITELLREP